MRSWVGAASGMQRRNARGSQGAYCPMPAALHSLVNERGSNGSSHKRLNPPGPMPARLMAVITLGSVVCCCCAGGAVFAPGMTPPCGTAFWAWASAVVASASNTATVAVAMRTPLMAEPPRASALVALRAGAHMGPLVGAALGGRD